MNKKFRIRLRETFRQVRCWIDDVEYVAPPFSGESRNDKFADDILQAISATMKAENFFDDRRVLIPTQYTVFISNADDVEWYGVKRDGLLQKLDRYVESRLAAIPQNYFDKQFVRLQPTPELKCSEIKVLHHWHSEPQLAINVSSRDEQLRRVTETEFGNYEFDDYGTIIRKIIH